MGPHFLCIGLQKAATGWLYHTLSKHNSFQMLPLKEFYFWNYYEWKSNKENYQLNFYDNFLEHLKKFKNKRKHVLDEKSYSYYLQNLERLINDISIKNYLNLFNNKENLCMGDLTPLSSILSTETIKKIKYILPDIKIIFIVRNPRDRLLSAFNMFLRNQMKKDGLQISEIEKYASTKKLETFLLMKDVKLRSFPTIIFQKWSTFFPDIHIISFDEIKKNPINVIHKIENYLKVKNKENVNFDLPINKKKDEPKIKNSKKYEVIIDEFLGDEIYKYKELLS